MKVLKFGGTSVGSGENIRRISEIIKFQDTDIIVVVSALGGITNLLLTAANTASANEGFNTCLAEVRDRHMDIISELFKGEREQAVKSKVTPYLDELGKIIQGVFLIGELTPKTLGKISGFGERMSSIIISEFLDAELIDSSKLILTDNNYLCANVDIDATYDMINKRCEDVSGVAVTPGFISSAKDGSDTTLGRGGSDYTAALFAAALDAEMLEIWTDVDGFMTADPRVINKAYSIPALTYSEAMELSHFGAKVIYPPTILPVYKKGISIRIKNTMAPGAEGTLIDREGGAFKDLPIKGISSISGITMMTVQGLGMVGVTGISHRLFGALAAKDINVILISQASSENSISFAIGLEFAEIAQDAVNNEFENEIENGRINRVSMEAGLSVVAIVGDNMKHSAGIAGKLFQTIGKNGINIVAIAQGASEQNISWVVKESDLRKTLNVVHESFFLSPFVELNIFLMGVGIVGKDLISQIHQQYLKLEKEHRLKLRLVGVANSRKMTFNRDGLNIEKVMEELDKLGERSDLAGFRDRIIAMNMFNSVFVDCTANADVAKLYYDIINNYISVVAANKVAASSDYHSYKQLKDLAGKRGVKLLYETNVGAGLPLISTINDLHRSGDHIIKIEAVLSGTLNYIFNTLSEDIPFSKAVKMAKEEGYAEPDPRIDLSGVDVIRKLVILARESGYKLEQCDVQTDSFIPQKYFDIGLDKFWEVIKEVDNDFEAKRKELEKDNLKWRFVGTFDNGKASVELKTVGPTHPFHDLEGSNNIVLLTSERYKEYPLQIKGYGAGAAVTAAGVFADLIKVSNI